MEHVNRVTVPYAAQDDLELLTAELIDRCLDSSFKGGDVLGQHPDTGEDVSSETTIHICVRGCVHACSRNTPFPSNVFRSSSELTRLHVTHICLHTVGEGYLALTSHDFAGVAVYILICFKIMR